MKKIVALLLVFIFVLSLCACGKSDENEIRIGIAAPDVTHGWVAGVAYYAEKYCKENNISYKIVTSSDAAEMSASISDLIAWNAGVIITYPQWTGMESTVSEVIESGVPVVSFDIDIASDGIYKVTGDNYGMGWSSAEYIASKVSSGAYIALLDVPSSGSVGSLRKQGFYDYFSSVGFDVSNVFEIQCSSFTREEGLKQMSDILTSHAQVDAVFSYDDELSLGCVQAISESGRIDVKAITGGGGMQDYFKIIADDSYAEMGLCSALYSPKMIEEAIKTAISLCNGEAVDAVITVPTTIVSRDNVSEYLDSENTIY